MGKYGWRIYEDVVHVKVKKSHIGEKRNIARNL